MATTSYEVTGMTCDHCATAVREEIGQIAGVTGIQVELATGQVTVASEAPLDDADVKAAVEEAGYELKE